MPPSELAGFGRRSSQAPCRWRDRSAAQHARRSSATTAEPKPSARPEHGSGDIDRSKPTLLASSDRTGPRGLRAPSSPNTESFSHNRPVRAAGDREHRFLLNGGSWSRETARRLQRPYGPAPYSGAQQAAAAADRGRSSIPGHESRKQHGCERMGRDTEDLVTLKTCLRRLLEVSVSWEGLHAQRQTPIA